MVVLAALGCGNTKGDGTGRAPVESSKALPPTGPAATGPAANGGIAQAAPPPPPVATAKLAVRGKDECGEEILCFEIVRGDVPVAVPIDLAKALIGPFTAPVVSPAANAVVFVGGERAAELRWWTEADGALGLVKFDAGVEAISPLVWSPSGEQLAFVVKGKSYPKSTRVFVLSLSNVGRVQHKSKHDVEVFTECGDECVPSPPVWRGEHKLEVPSVGDGAPGPMIAVALRDRSTARPAARCCCEVDVGDFFEIEPMTEVACLDRKGTCLPGKSSTSCE